MQHLLFSIEDEGGNDGYSSGKSETKRGMRVMRKGRVDILVQ
jgi:hypothetical protein